MAAKARRGVALIFLVVTLAVMLILATVVLANTAGARQRDTVVQAVSELLRFGYEIGVNTKKPSFRGDVGSYPGRLSHLFQTILTTDQNVCGTTYSGSDVGKWTGPYHLVPMVRDSSYQMIPGLIAIDTLLRIDAPGGNPDTLGIVMRNVSISLAQDLGLAFDGVSTGTGANIQFIPNGTNPVTVRYNIPITSC
jgi:hypothetical protein